MRELIFVFTILVLLLISIIIFKICRSYYLSRKYEIDYKIAMITIINENKEVNEEYFESINNIYTIYSNNKVHNPLDVFSLNAKLINELRNQRYTKYYKNSLPDNGKIANEIEEIDKRTHQRLRSDDDKLIKILEKIDALPLDDQMKSSMETIRVEILSYIQAIDLTCEGRIIEKDIAYANISLKLKKVKQMRILNYVIGFIGIVSGLITIFNNFVFK